LSSVLHEMTIVELRTLQSGLPLSKLKSGLPLS
jgi:hypothetical protein